MERNIRFFLGAILWKRFLWFDKYDQFGSLSKSALEDYFAYCRIEKLTRSF